ncbi:hypothetical protein GCM10027414_02870 [Humibacter ginsengiterrae]
MPFGFNAGSALEVGVGADDVVETDAVGVRAGPAGGAVHPASVKTTPRPSATDTAANARDVARGVEPPATDPTPLPHVHPCEAQAREKSRVLRSVAHNQTYTARTCTAQRCMAHT